MHVPPLLISLTLLLMPDGGLSLLYYTLMLTFKFVVNVTVNLFMDVAVCFVCPPGR